MKRILPIFAILLLSFLAQSCGGDAPNYRIGVSQCSQDDWRSKMNDEIYREVMFHPEATVEIRSADDSNDKQIADIQYFLDNKFDIIIAAPNEADAITPIIKKAYQSGTPVIVFDRNIHGDTYTAFQGVDNTAIGRMAARYARNLAGRGGKVIEIHGLKGSTPAEERHNGFAEAAASEGLEMLGTAYGNWNYDDAAIAADSMLAAHPDVDLVYAHNDRMAIAASEVARRRGLDIKVIGIDAAPQIGIRAVADSVIDATFLYPTEGHQLIRTALAILKGEPYDTINQLPLSSAVDLSNADILLMQNDALSEETRKIKLLKSQVDEFWDRHSAQTWLLYATIAIALLLLGVLFLVLRAFWQRRKHQADLDAATQSKLRFFTNVSHDLRTPLTLIAEPVEQLAAAPNLDESQKTLIRIADKNVRILKRLINQILDFRKYENGKLDIRLAEAPVGELLAEWAEAFRATARKRDIKLSLDISLPEGFTMAVDTEKIERVFFNLVSNAVKYTPDNGRIAVVCRLEGGELVLSVADTGMGIPAEDLGNIFDRFFQVDRVHPNGSGIGLSLAKAFVELHGGSISVDSTVGKGSTFTVRLPVSHIDSAATGAVPTISSSEIESELGKIDQTLPALAPSSDPSDPSAPQKPLLLVIDDNEDMRLLVKQLMSGDYEVIGAPDGKEGMRLAAKYVPDIIICDVMMPVMDGLELCRRVKEEISTSHIPVLLLTACSMDEQRAQGYDSGADGYLAKPFNAAVLRSRCKSLVDNRKRIKDLWTSSPLPSNPNGVNIKAEGAAKAPRPAVATAAGAPAVDNEFYARFLEIVRREMGAPELNVDTLASKMGLGRSQFYRKIKALTNYSPVELLRSLRLKQARELLASTSRSVSEIAYEVGFSTPAYFTRCYREAFGETPTDLRDRLGN